MVKKKILIVDDELPIRVMMHQFFQLSGFETATADDGEKALKYLKTQVPDLVITDVLLPGMDGWNLCKIIKGDARMKGVPVLVLTGNTSALEMLAYESKADAYLPKPFSNDKLLEIAKSLIYKRS